MRIKRFNESSENEENEENEENVNNNVNNEFYLLQLNDMKPSYSEVKAVDKETWDWIHSPSDRPANNPTFQWDDTNASPALRQRILDFHNDQNIDLNGNTIQNNWDEVTSIDISSGSWQNDRAIHAVSIVIDGEHAETGTDFQSVNVLVERLKNNGWQGPVGQYDGHLY